MLLSILSKRNLDTCIIGSKFNTCRIVNCQNIFFFKKIMATGPKLASSPLELLTNDGTREPSILTKFWGPAVCGGLGFMGVVLTNWALKRPLMSGIQQHVIATAIGVGIGKYVEDYRNEYLAERDAVFRHYVELHPEDFPAYARKKYSEVLEPWVPIR